MKIKKIGIIIGVISFLIYLVGGTLISFIAIQTSIADATAEHNATVSTLVADIVAEPLRLGSFAEANSRVQSFIKKGMFQCADLSYEGMPISKCANSDGLRPISTILNLGSEANSNPVLVTYVDEDTLRSLAIRRTLGVVGFIFAFGLVFLFGIFYLLKRVGAEIVQVSDEVLGVSTLPSSKRSPIFEINFLRAKMSEYIKLKDRELESKAFLRISRQVAHDIRSPLSVLEMALVDSSLSGEKKNLLVQASNRIKSIADDLLLKSKSANETLIANGKASAAVPKHEMRSSGVCSVGKVLEVIVAEKKLIAPQVEINLSLPKNDILAAADLVMLSRIISNLLNNSTEAADPDRNLVITVSVRNYSQKAVVVIQDNGVGISPGTLSRIGEAGFTSKSDGNGIGISSSKSALAAWGGDLQIVSQIGVGTMVTVILPLAAIGNE